MASKKSETKTVKADIDINDLLRPEPKKDLETAMFDVFKDLTNKDKAETLTELSDNELKLLLRLDMLSQMRKNPLYLNVANLFMKLRINKDRNSRKEILSAIKNAHPEQQNPFGNDKMRQLLS